jgi:hypothetical protein
VERLSTWINRFHDRVAGGDLGQIAALAGDEKVAVWANSSPSAPFVEAMPILFDSVNVVPL